MITEHATSGAAAEAHCDPNIVPGRAMLVAEHAPEFRECCRQLQSPTPSTRRRAAARLGDFGVVAIAPLRRALVDLDVEVQVAAVGSVGKIGGDEGYQLLLEALQSSELKVRIAAAQLLGEVGRADAIGPLIAAYRRCFAGRSARRQWWVGPACLVGIMVILWKLIWSFNHHLSSVPLLFQVLTSLVAFLVCRRQWSVPQTFLSAVLKVAERAPGPGMHVLVPELRAVASDRLQYGHTVRKATREAAERIESLAAAFHDLPMPAAAPQSDINALPVPAALEDVTASTHH
jgi:HEAT repeat protein